jgi:TP901 family phage tail tape measure protein
LNTAFEKAGTMAAKAGMSYGDLAAAVETVGPKFSSAEVAGQKLQATLLALSVQGNDNFKPAVVGMSQALDNLAKAELTDAQMKELVGASQITMLQALIDGKEQYKEFTKSLVGTNTAYEMMQQNNDNLEGTINKLKSSWDAFMITLGQSSFIQGAIGLL